MQVKGTAIDTRFAYIRERCSNEERDRILKKIGPAFAELYHHGAWLSSWYPLADFIALNLAIDAVKGQGDLALLPEIAAFAADKALNTVYRVFYRLGSPEFIIQRAARVWGQYYDFGNLSVEISGPKRCLLILREVPQPSHIHCLLVQGWAKRTLELSGAKSVIYECLRCREKKLPDCAWQFSWQ
jgi:hypothetical protein